MAPGKRSGPSTKGKGAVYDSGVDNPLPSVEYGNEEDFDDAGGQEEHFQEPFPRRAGESSQSMD